jgi:hypothetical protein
MGTLLQDVRYGLRMLVKKPTFTIRGYPDAGSGRGSQHGHFQHRKCRVAAFSALPRCGWRVLASWCGPSRPLRHCPRDIFRKGGNLIAGVDE